MAYAHFANELNGRDLKRYAEIGFAFRKLAELDFQLDEFMFCMSRLHPRFCSQYSRSYPNSFGEKIDFVVKCYVTFPPLRSFGDATGRSDINQISYALEEVFSFRNSFFHSVVTLTTETADGFIWDVERYERTKRGSFIKARYDFGSGYLDRVVDYSRYLTRWLHDAQRSIQGEDVARFQNHANKVNVGHYLTVQDEMWEEKYID